MIIFLNCLNQNACEPFVVLFFYLFGKQVFYSDFSDDPWQRASVWFSPSTSQPYHLAMCDDCGHCMDMHTPSASDPAPLVSVSFSPLFCSVDYILG